MEELQAKWTFDQGGFAKALIAPTKQVIAIKFFIIILVLIYLY